MLPQEPMSFVGKKRSSGVGAADSLRRVNISIVVQQHLVDVSLAVIPKYWRK